MDPTRVGQLLKTEGVERVYAVGSADGGWLNFPISNPTSLMEPMPADVLAWSHGKALVATDSPMDPVTYDGITYTAGQANNTFVFPGIGLGFVVAGAHRVTKGMLDASAKAVARQSNPTAPGASLLPDIKDLRAVSAVVAEAVYHAAVQDGAATRTHDDLVQIILDAMWLPEYEESL